MVLNGAQPARSRLRYLLFAALGVIGIVYFWTANTDTTHLKEAVSSWPAAVASHFSDSGNGNDSIPPSDSAQGNPADAPYFVFIGDSTTRGWPRMAAAGAMASCGGRRRAATIGQTNPPHQPDAVSLAYIGSTGKLTSFRYNKFHPPTRRISTSSALLSSTAWWLI